MRPKPAKLVAKTLLYPASSDGGLEPVATSDGGEVRGGEKSAARGLGLVVPFGDLASLAALVGEFHAALEEVGVESE